MFLITVPRLSTVEEPFSFKSLISVTLSPSASSAPFESLTLMSIVISLVRNYSARLLLPLWEERNCSGRHTPRKRGIQYAAASRFNHKRLWNTGSPAFAGDDSLN